jgi:phosphoinositide-3-kinase regulatory subunit 4
LYGDIEAILANLFIDTAGESRESGYGDVLVIVLAAITSNLRVAQFAASKLQALDMLKTIAQYVTDECILERIVPFLHLLVRDNWPSVRAEAIRTLSICLSIIRTVPRSDFNLFPEYILPVITTIPKDVDVQVRIALAGSIAELALSSQRFLELSQLHINQETSGEEASSLHYQVHGTYDSELNQLHETFQSIIVHLLSDYDSNVKKAFLHHSAGKLCTFFGAQKAKEVILSHMITFLNDKNNWILHSSFFEAIIEVATQIGQRSLDVLEALLQQGLGDTEEVVICGAIDAVTVLCEKGLFDMRFLLSSLQQIVPFLSHPNIWARYGAVGFVLSAAKQLDEIGVLCYIVPIIRPFLTHTIIDLNDELVLLNALKEPIPRSVLDYILKQQNIDGLFEW